ncbi:MAG: DUF167 domain-containing protein [Spirochaetales bacterium]|nr:DUF167 domain-containing protein [Spirochaetales bacterium]
MGAKKGKGGAAPSPGAARPLPRGAASGAPELSGAWQAEGGTGAGGAPLEARVSGGVARIAVKALPNAPRSAFAGLRGGELAVRVAAAPDKGKANEELVRFVAGALGLSRSQVSLESGATGRHKLIAIPEAALSRLRRILADSRDDRKSSG